jgi:hypothetical protein
VTLDVADIYTCCVLCRVKIFDINSNNSPVPLQMRQATRIVEMNNKLELNGEQAKFLLWWAI